MMTLLVKRLSDTATLPAYAHPGDAGLDLFAAVALSLEPGESKLVGTGIAIELPPNTEAQVRPRSGLALKNGITVLNTPGTIDRSDAGVVCRMWFITAVTLLAANGLRPAINS